MERGSHSFAMAMQEEVVVLEWPIERKRVLLSIIVREREKERHERSTPASRVHAPKLHTQGPGTSLHRRCSRYGQE